MDQPYTHSLTKSVSKCTAWMWAAEVLVLLPVFMWARILNANWRDRHRLREEREREREREYLDLYPAYEMCAALKAKTKVTLGQGTEVLKVLTHIDHPHPTPPPIQLYPHTLSPPPHPTHTCTEREGERERGLCGMSCTGTTGCRASVPPRGLLSICQKLSVRALGSLHQGLPTTSG